MQEKRCLFCEEELLQKTYGKERLYCNSRCFFLSKKTGTVSTYLNMWLIVNQILVTELSKKSKGMGQSRIYVYANKGIPYRKSKLDGSIIAMMIYTVMCEFQAKPHISNDPVDYRLLLAEPEQSVTHYRTNNRIPLVKLINDLFGKNLVTQIMDVKYKSTDEGRMCFQLERKCGEYLKSNGIEIGYRESSFGTYLRYIKKNKKLFVHSNIAELSAKVIHHFYGTLYDYRQLMNPMDREEIKRHTKGYPSFSLKNRVINPPVFKKPTQ